MIKVWRYYQPNPLGRNTGDCVIRAISKTLDVDWTTAYDYVTDAARRQYDMPEANHVWIGLLKDAGFKLSSLPDRCPYCYTVRDFALEHPSGLYVLGTGTHVVTVEDGDYFDSYDSGDLVPIFYLRYSHGL